MSTRLCAYVCDSCHSECIHDAPADGDGEPFARFGLIERVDGLLHLATDEVLRRDVDAASVALVLNGGLHEDDDGEDEEGGKAGDEAGLRATGVPACAFISGL